MPAQPAAQGKLAALSSPQDATAAAQSATAAAQARKTGHPVVVSALTTSTSTVTVAPDGVRTLTDRALPVRVRVHGRWVPVSTRLSRVAGGMLSPAAVPGDAVAFSPGGAGPMAVISSGAAHVALWWPGRLPAPSVTGASATYRDVLPGVDLVLTATSAASGGFREVLVVRTPAAARDPALARIVLRVSTAGARLAGVPGGGLAASLTGPGARGAFVAPPPRMWDSSSVPTGSAGARPALAGARAVGASLAPLGAGPVSSAAGPAAGARLARVTASVARGDASLALLPDLALLGSSSTRFPVFIDPSFTFVSGTGDEKAFDPVQSGSGCTGSHYDDSSDYPHSPVGYDNFQAGSCQFNDTDYSLYRVAIPQGVFASDANLLTASFQVTEVYTSSCSASPDVTVSWIGAISSSTGWPGPGRTSNNVDATAAFGPDSGSCNSTANFSSRVSKGFNVKADLNAISSASNITFRVWEKSDTNDADHKQLTDNPTLTVQWNDTPNVPSGEEQNSTNSTTGATKCDTSTSGVPVMGATASTNGPYVFATYGDPDGDSVKGTVQYWNNATPGTTFTVSAGTSLTGSNGEVAAQIPASFTSGMTDGTVVGWKAQAQDGSSGGYGPFTSAWSKPCYFAVYPKAPDPPTPAASAGSVNAGSPVTFTITQASGTTASKFVWALDQTPPAVNPPVGQTCTTSSSATPNCVISSGTATLTITAPSPGPHDLWVYEVDPAGNSSASAMATVTASADPAVSYTSGSSLAANFAAALGAGQSYDNTMISNTSGASCGATSGDGTGTNFVQSELSSAGWASASAPGANVTIDGTPFTLPESGSCAADNVLAANQTIGTGPAGAQGSAVVFLATASYAYAQVPGLATGSPDTNDPVLAADATVPAVMGGTAVAGQSCTGSVGLDANESCAPATGTVNYAAGCPLGAQASYALTVPSWKTGPTDIAALTVPDVVLADGTKTARTSKIYAFAVPVDGQCTVTSVTLPDVSGSAQYALTGGSTGITQPQPALHIFAMALRNTTTATPIANGLRQSSPSGSAWTGAFESPVESAFGPPPGYTFSNMTMRISLSPNFSAPAGAQVRIRLSDPGVLSADGDGQLSVGAATIAPAWAGAIPAQAPVPLAFGGFGSVTLPEGGDIYSDPLTLPFAVTAGQSLLVSLWIKNTTLPVLPINSFGSGAVTWFGPSAAGDQTGDTTGNPFTGTGSTWIGAVPLLAGVDVTSPAVASGGVTVSPGSPTVVVAGNNVTDGWNSSALPDSLNAPSKRLAGQLASQGLTGGYAVADAGIQSNQVLASATWAGGVSLLARLDRDVLAEPDVGTVIIDQGLQDLIGQGSAASATSLDNGLTALETQLQGFGVNVIVTALTPCAGYSNSTAGDSCTTGSGATVDAARTQVNSNISGGDNGLPYCPAGFSQTADPADSVLANGASPEALATSPTSYDAGDHANLSWAGYAALAPAVFGPPGYCTLAPGAYPLPPP